MQTFARLLSAAYIGKEPARPLASEALGAVLLDVAGVTAEEIEKGRVLIWVPDGVAYAIDAALERIYGPRACTVHGLTKLRAEGSLGGRIVLLDDMHAIHPDWWMSVIGEHGLGCALVVIDGGAVDPEVEAWVTRQIVVPAVDTWPVIPDAIRLATGGHFILRETDVRGATLQDLRSALGPRTTASEAIQTLRKLLNARGAKKKRMEADAAQAEATLMDGLGGEPVAVSAERVIKRLSEMTGFGDADDWGMRLAEDIRAYKSGEVAWCDLDKGALLVGPPGSGKTTFASALAAECDVELVITTYTDWHEGSGDAVAKALKKLFEAWRKKAKDGPFILFLDEIDTMGARGKNGHGEHWYRSIINAWLQFLDGAIARDGIIVVAATNNLDAVDPAMLRPGRLDRVIDLPYPGIEAMAGIIRHHLGDDAVIDEAELSAAARACRGKSPAMIEQLCREARRLCRQTYKRKVCAEDVTDVLNAQRLMLARSPLLDDCIAVHEASHAVVALALRVSVQWIDIDSGQVQLVPGRTMHDESAILDDIVIGMAGIAGEGVVLGHRSSSGGKDIEQATSSALSIHARLGLGVAGRVSLDVGRGPVLDSALHAAVRATTDTAYTRAERLCRIHRANIRRVADRLRTERYLDASEIQALMRSPLRVLVRQVEDEPDSIPCWAPSRPRAA